MTSTPTPTPTPPHPGEVRWIGAVELADYLCVSIATVRKWTRTGMVPCHRLPGGRSVRFRCDEIDKWMMEQGRT